LVPYWLRLPAAQSPEVDGEPETQFSKLHNRQDADMDDGNEQDTDMDDGNKQDTDIDDNKQDCA
jgi:hypothetical protein